MWVGAGDVMNNSLFVRMLFAAGLLLFVVQFYVGMAAAPHVDFIDSRVSFPEARAAISQGSWSDIKNEAHEWIAFPPVAIVIVIIFSLFRARVVEWMCASTALLLPVLLSVASGDLERVVAMPLLALLVEPLLLLGILDGESWSEGWVAYAAVGWWMLFWAGWIALLSTGPALSRAIRSSVGRCADCGYDLRGDLDSGCPECGWGREEKPRRRDDATEGSATAENGNDEMTGRA